MYKYEYILKYKNETYKCTHPVVGFEEEGVKFGKESENKGVIKSYAGEFTLLGNDANFIRNILFTYGLNEQIRLDVFRIDFLKGNNLEYSSFIDLSTVTIYSNRVNFSLKQGGFITYIDNISNKEFEILTGFKPITYTANKYDFQIFINANSTMLTPFDTDEIPFVLATSLKENNNNLEDIVIFEGAKQSDTSASNNRASNDNCFIKVLGQKYINKLSFKFNIDKFIFKNYGAINIPIYTDTIINVRYRFTLYAYNNIYESWPIDDPSLVYSQEYNVYSKYSVSFNNNQFISEFTGTLLNGNQNYLFESNVSQYLSYKDSDNIKFVLAVTPIIMYFYHGSSSTPYYLVNDFGDLEIYPNIEIKCDVKNFELFGQKQLNVWKVSDVYKYIFSQNKYTYKVNYDLRNIESLPYYLTSTPALCGENRITTTLTDLLKFIYLATGLRQIVNESNGVYNVYFEKYENSFKDIEIAKIEQASEIVIETDPDKIYTDVEIGWNNKETGIFKSLEYNTLNKFRTGYNNFESNTLSLTCPYSASITDLETIIYNSGKNDKSNESKDVFIIECYNDNGTLKNKQFSGTSPDLLCGNVSLTPKRLLEVHKYELSDFLYHLNVLKFNSSNGKADITLNGVTENTDITFNNQIMQPFILSFDGVINQSIIKIDARKYGYFTFMYEGNYIRGYIAEGSDSVSVAANGNVSKLRLIVKNNVNL